MLRRGDRTTARAAWLAVLGISWFSCASAMAGIASDDGRQARMLGARQPGKPAYLWLWYADGGPMPEYSEYCSNIPNPPAYQCNFGSTRQDCQRYVQAYLDEWYKDFNLVFTFTRPPSADYYVIVITSGWPKCAQEVMDRTGTGSVATEGGVAPLNLSCTDNINQTAIAIQCGTTAHACATIIAHEHGHLVGLVHTTGADDVMHASVQVTSNGFSNESLTAVVDDLNNCAGPKQKSYQKMLDALGAWSVGAKPTLFVPMYDAGVPDVAGDARTDAAGVGPDADTAVDVSAPGGTIGGPSWVSRIDGSAVVLPGFDAIPRTEPVLPDASPFSPAAKGGACDFAQTPTTTSLATVLAALVLARALSRASARGRRSPRRP